MYFQKIILRLFTSEEFKERQLQAYQYFFDKHYKTRAKDANLDLDCNRFRKFEDSSASCPWPALKATTKDSFKPVYTLDKERSGGQTKKIYNPVLFFTVNTMFGWVPQITGQSKVGYRRNQRRVTALMNVIIFILESIYSVLAGHFCAYFDLAIW